MNTPQAMNGRITPDITIRLYLCGGAVCMDEVGWQKF